MNDQHVFELAHCGEHHWSVLELAPHCSTVLCCVLDACKVCSLLTCTLCMLYRLHAPKLECLTATLLSAHAGSVAPGSSASVELFKADLLIPPPGLQVTFTYKPPSPPTPTTLQLWCWMEPSNAAHIDAGDTDDAGTGVENTKRAVVVEGVRVLAMLQPDGLGLVSADANSGSQAQLELQR